MGGYGDADDPREKKSKGMMSGSELVSVVGIATGYGLDGPASNPGVGEIFRTCPDRPRGPPSLLYNGTRSFPEVKSGRAVTLTHRPLLVLWS